MGRKKILILSFLFFGCAETIDPTTVKIDECEVACDSRNKTSPNKNEFSDYELCLVSCSSQQIYIYIKEENEKENK
jgi:hypothetical protein